MSENPGRRPLSFKELFGTDKVKETEGITVGYGDTFRVRIARAGGSNIKFAKVLEEERRPYARMIANEVLPEDIASQIVHNSFAKAIVLDWSGLYDEDGAEIPFSVENAVSLFRDEPEFFTFIYGEANRLANFRRSVREAEAKNS